MDVKRGSILVNELLLRSVGVIALLMGIWHLLCILNGLSWYVFARAPKPIIESAIEGSLLAPIATLVVAFLFFTCSVYAFSAAGVLRKLFLLKSALFIMACFCIVRGLIAVPLLVTANGIDLWQVVASSVWLYVGVCFSFGYLSQLKVRE